MKPLELKNTKEMKSTHLTISLSLFLSFNLFSQEAVIQKKERKLDFFIEKSGLYIQENNITSKIFYKNIGHHSQDRFYFSAMEPIVEVKAYTKVPTKKGKFKTKKVIEMETKDIVEPGIFYGGHKVREFVYPAVVPTAIGVLDYTKNIKDPHLLNSFYFDDRYNVEESVFSVSFPKEVKIAFNLFNTEDLNLMHQVTTEEDVTTHTWTVKDLEPRVYNSNAPSTPHFAPHIILRIESYKTKNKSYRVAGNTDDLFKWYNTLVNQVPKENDLKALENKVGDLTKESKNQKEKIESIYQWVQSNIKYIAFENGMAGFVPRAPGAVFSKKYGDCKDMANLLQTMLNMAEVPAYLTWVGTNSKPYSYKEVPCTIADNHMICAVKAEGGFQFLDATNSYLSYGRPPRMIQGKEALIRIDDDNYEIIKVPESDSKANVRMDNVSLEIEDDLLVGSVKSSLSGYLKERYQYFYTRTEAAPEASSIRSFLSLGQKNSSADNLKIEDNPNKVEFDFTGKFKNDILKASGKLYVNLNLDSYLEEFVVKDLDTRIHPIENDYRKSYSYSCSLKIPEGYAVDFIPENKEENYGDFLFKVDYKVENGTVNYTKEITSKFLMLQKNDFKKYDEFCTNLSKINQQKLTLKKL